MVIKKTASYTSILLYRLTSMGQQSCNKSLLFLSILLAFDVNAIVASTIATPLAVSLSLSAHPPENVSIGQRVTLQCNVWNRKDPKQATVWFKNTEYFASNGTLEGAAMDTGRTTMKNTIADDNLEIDILTIDNVQPEDQANYTCQLWRFRTGVESDIVRSASFVFKVHDVVTSAKPECVSNKALMVSLNEVIALSCQVGLANAMTDYHLYWTELSTNEIYEGVTTIDSQSNTARMVLHFIMTDHYNNMSFVCHMNQTDGSARNHDTCTVGPFSILYSTTMSMSQNYKTTPSRQSSLPMFHGYIFIIVIICGMSIICCASCLACYLCCRKTRHGEYRFGSRFSAKRKPLVPTPSGASDVIDMSHPRQHSIPEFESPYYSSVGPGSEGRVKLAFANDRSAADGASYTALQKTGNNSNASAETSHSADAVDEDGYNVVGLKTPSTLPIDKKISGSSSSLLRGLSLNSLSRQGSRSSTRPSTPVTDELPYYKTLMGDTDKPKTLETPYYLCVFPPAVGELDIKDKAKRSMSDIGKASTVPKLANTKKIDRKEPTRNTTPSSRELLTNDDDYLCPTPTITVSNSDPKFSNAVYNVFN